MSHRFNLLRRLLVPPVVVLVASFAIFGAAQAAGVLDQSSNTNLSNPDAMGSQAIQTGYPATQTFTPTVGTLSAVEILLDNRTGAVGYGINFGWGPGIPSTGLVSILDAANQVIAGPTAVVVQPLPNVAGQCEWMAASGANGYKWDSYHFCPEWVHVDVGSVAVTPGAVYRIKLEMDPASQCQVQAVCLTWAYSSGTPKGYMTYGAPAAPPSPVQTITFFGGSAGFPINYGPGPNDYLPLDPSAAFPDPTTDWTNDGGATWHAAYLVGGHPWGVVPGTDSWVNCGPTLRSPECINTTITYRVRFDVPADWSNPTIALQVLADNGVIVSLNGTPISGGITSNLGTPPVALDASLVTGVNELIFAVTDGGGVAGFNYRADLSMNAPTPVTLVPPTPPAPPACPVGSYSATGIAPCTPAPAGSFVAVTGADHAELCAPGTFQALVGQTSCTPAPAGSYVAVTGATEAQRCAPGTFQALVGQTSCVPAPAGTYVDVHGAAAATTCPVGTTSGIGATSCYPIDTDGDGVPDVDDAFPDSNLGGTLSVNGCPTGLANQLLTNGASMNDLMAAAVSGGANHGAVVNAVSALSNQWKGAGLISGRDHGTIVSCVARSDAGKKNR